MNASRHSIQHFIETCLIRNEGLGADDVPEAASWSYQRTLLRGLMLIKLLDSMKQSPSLQQCCLFQASASYKTSTSIVRALFQMLNPSAGEPTRPLSHVGYNVTHAQYPLEEYRYKVDNLAVDLRDGVRLTRLVELLLYPSASPTLECVHDSDSTTTVVLPTGELLPLTGGQCEWPLSQHLKFPCLSRAVKLYNVQIALSALQGVKGMTGLLQNIEAEDIVDGYREKTVKLLWGLTSKWGLQGLVEWDDVEREIKRILRSGRSGATTTGDALLDVLDDEQETSFTKSKSLLMAWAKAIAQKKNILVSNITTSFADGQVFGAIVDEYAVYLDGASKVQEGKPLGERLVALGCNRQFADLFSASEGSSNPNHIYDRDFVLAALAFLCSRMLAPTKTTRATVAIQRAWRQYRRRVFDSRIRQLRLIATSCATAVQAKRQNHDGAVTEVHKDTGNAGHKAEAQCDNSSQEKSLGSIGDEDIWLSLE
jgi:abnormal spindle-like microcephaly-associated protein